MSQLMYEIPAEMKNRRRAQAGDVDFAAMYAAHDSFEADIKYLLELTRAGEGFSSDALRTWERFSQQLHNHSTAEDSALWPRVRKLADAEDLELLDWMEAEHALIELSLTQVGAAFEEGNGTQLINELELLHSRLAPHTHNEETLALPVVARTIGEAGWKAYGDEIRNRAARG